MTADAVPPAIAREGQSPGTMRSPTRSPGPGSTRDPETSLPACFAGVVTQHGSRPALVSPRWSLPSAELDAAASRLAHRLLEPGGAVGGRVAVLIPQNVAGIRYRLAFVRRGEGAPADLYDCHAPKGHHRHLKGIEEPYHFVDVDQLLMDFTADVRRVMEDAPWPRR